MLEVAASISASCWRARQLYRGMGARTIAGEFRTIEVRCMAVMMACLVDDGTDTWTWYGKYAIIWVQVPLVSELSGTKTLVSGEARGCGYNQSSHRLGYMLRC